MININKFKPIEGTDSEKHIAELEEERRKETEKYRKEHPIDDSTLRSYEPNNSSSSNWLSYHEQQAQKTSEYMQKRLETMGEIRAGRAPNGTDGIWQ